MNGILENIVQYKKLEIQQLKAIIPQNILEIDHRMKNSSKSMEFAIVNGSGVIAEFKRASPSKRSINVDANVTEIVTCYQNAGVSAISVLTDSHFFSALPDDLTNARKNITIPILRKDFIIDPYQIFQSKTMGSDCILLIAAILSANEIKHFTNIANDLGLGSIVEVHNHTELEKLSGNESMVGVNNRNLDTFNVDIETSLHLAGQLGDVIKITESGLGFNSNLKALVNAGYHGFLVGESFMKDADPGMACTNFINEINQLKPSHDS